MAARAVKMGPSSPLVITRRVRRVLLLLFFFLHDLFFLPLSVVMSQYTLSAFPDASGSIQNSPSPTESSLCRMSLHERPGAQFVEPFFTEINLSITIKLKLYTEKQN